jgi:hypothetical protein
MLTRGDFGHVNKQKIAKDLSSTTCFLLICMVSSCITNECNMSVLMSSNKFPISLLVRVIAANFDDCGTTFLPPYFSCF